MKAEFCKNFHEEIEFISFRFKRMSKTNEKHGETLKKPNSLYRKVNILESDDVKINII